MSMKRFLLTTSVLALGLGGVAIAQTGAGSSAGAGAMGSNSGSPSYSAPSNSSGQGTGINDSQTDGSGANGGPMADNSAAPASAHGRMSNSRTSPDQIKQAQEALQTQGLYHGQLDGKWGPQTRRAVARFQKQKGLKQTAQLDEPTIDDLQNGAMSGGDNMRNPSHSGAMGPDAMHGNGPSSAQTNPGGDNNATAPAH